MEGTTQLATKTNIVFVLADVLETNLIDMQSAYSKQGCVMRHEVKRNFNTALAAIKRLKREVDHCDDETQESFGNDADIVNALLITIIDRCGNDDEFAFRMYNYIKSFPSKLKMDLQLDGAFSHIFDKH